MLVPRVYFDLDGVLVDSRPGIVRCVNEALASLGYAGFPSQRIERIIGPPLQDGFAELLSELGESVAEVGACVLAYRERYALVATNGGTIVQPGVVDMLTSIGARAELAVATSKPLRFADPILESLGLRDAFALVVGPTPETDGESKTATLGRAIERMSERDGAVAARWSCMIGDRYHDVVAAHACAIVPIGCTWGFGSERELRDAGATYVVRDPAEIVPLVDRLAARA